MTASPAARPFLDGGDVHLWWAGLEPSGPVPADAERALSDDERARAARYRRPGDAARFVAGRLALRELLGRYLGIAPRNVRFAYGTHGRPCLAGDADAGLRFSAAHAAGAALFALARGREVGVDLERVRDDVAALDVARQFFAPEEAAALGTLPAAERAGRFFRLWTRKEAYLKARGTGLAVPRVAPGYVAAVVVEGTPTVHEVRTWN